MAKLRIPQNALAVAALALSPHIPGGITPIELQAVIVAAKMPKAESQRDEGGLMTLDEAARYLSVSTRTVWGWAKSGRLRAVRLSPPHATSRGFAIGGRVGYPRKQIIALSEGRAVA